VAKNQPFKGGRPFERFTRGIHKPTKPLSAQTPKNAANQVQITPSFCQFIFISCLRNGSDSTKR
jgi:hypothetical protein